MPFGPPQRASGVAVQTYGLVGVMSSASASNTQRPSDVGVESVVPYSSSEVDPVCPRKAAFGGAAEGGRSADDEKSALRLVAERVLPVGEAVADWSRPDPTRLIQRFTLWS